MPRIFEQHILPASPKMHRYAYTFLRDKAAAADVVQECLTKIWTKRAVLADVLNPEAWAMRIVRNQCLDWVKLNRMAPLGSEADHLATSHATDSQLLWEDQHKWLEMVVQSLPAKHRDAYFLREVEEMSYQDIAEVLSITVDDVKVSIHRARTHVRKTLQKLDAYGIAN
jgi:RNA polymerase sigma-70 factor (ECF subfamily)